MSAAPGARLRRGGLADVVQGGYCVGCGACAAMDPAIRIEMDEMLRYRPVLPPRPADAAEAVCPFATATPDEDALAAALFASPAHKRDPHLGSWLAAFTGWVTEEDYREKGSSGGMGAWILSELLREGLVDAVVHVKEQPRTPGTQTGADTPLFAFAVSRSVGEVRTHAKSRYYPVEMSGVIAHMLETPGRYAVVGVPCFCTALRHAARQSDVLAERLAFVVGIVCGHLKSGAFAEALAWQCGVPPKGLSAIDFRVKLPDRPASKYGLRVDGTGPEGPMSQTRPMEGLVGQDWGQGLFKLKACEFCDDVLAETADVVVGDAWLPDYDADARGTNVAVVRNAQILALMEKAARAGRLHLKDEPPERVVQSQAAGFRHRRDGLAYRLWLADRAGAWRPDKRVAPGRSHLTRKLRHIHELRLAMGQDSHAAFLAAKRQGRFDAFAADTASLMQRYLRTQRASLPRRALGKLKRLLLARLRPKATT